MKTKTLNTINKKSLADLWFEIDETRKRIDSIDRKFKSMAVKGDLIGFAQKIPYRTLKVWNDKDEAIKFFGDVIFKTEPITITQARKDKKLDRYKHFTKQKLTYKYITKEEI